MPPIPSPRHIATIVLCLATTAMLSGCSLGLKLAYNNLDWFVNGRVNDFVELTDEQQAHFDAAFDEWWLWHRSAELPIYATRLRELSARIPQGLSEEDVAGIQQDIDQRYRLALARAIPNIRPLLSSLNDDQVASVLAELQKRSEDYREEYVDLSPAKRRSRLIKASSKQLKRWLGGLNDDQRQRIERWADEHDDLTESWLASRLAWRERLATALEQRRSPDLEGQVDDLLLNARRHWSPEHVATFEKNQRRWISMIVEVIALADAKQRSHLGARLDAYAEVLTQLSQVSLDNTAADS